MFFRALHRLSTTSRPLYGRTNLKMLPLAMENGALSLYPFTEQTMSAITVGALFVHPVVAEPR